jgi:hypothetical protein
MWWMVILAIIAILIVVGVLLFQSDIRRYLRMRSM